MTGILPALLATAALVAAGLFGSTRPLPVAGLAERWTAGCVCAFIGLVVATQFLSLVGGIGRTGFLIATLLLLAAGWALRTPSPPPAGDAASTSLVLRFLLALLLLASSVIAVSALWRGVSSPVLIDSDGPIYHLPFAVRWLQDGTLSRVWTPFGEMAATYFPGNGEIWLCWLLALVGDDRLAKVGQWFFLLPTATALYALGRRVGGDGISSLWPPLSWIALPFVGYYSVRPNVDFPMTFLLVAGALFSVRAMHEGEATPRRGSLTLAGLAFGAAAGAKSVALLFALAPFVAVLWMARRSTRSMLQTAAAALIGGGYWYVRNWLETGNPLYPYRLSLAGLTVFDGWYDAAVMRATSEYHIPVDDVSRAAAIFALALPAPLGAAMALAFVIGIASLWSRRPAVAPASLTCTALALLWAGEYWFVQPYNTQPRFLLPALAVGFVPLAALRGWWGLLPAALLAATTLPSLRDVSHLDARLMVGGIVVLAIASLIVALRPRWRAATLVSASLATLLLAPTISRPRGATPFFYSTRDFGERLFPAWARLQAAVDSDANGQGAVVGYAGTNLPYFLAGPTQKNRVRYVNVQGDATWLPHDHFRARRREGSMPAIESAFPQWHRDRPDKAAWLRNVDALGVGYFFVARENFHGRPDAPADTPPFPIEYDWITATPDRFERLGPPAQSDGAEPWGIAFRVRPAPQMRTN